MATNTGYVGRLAAGLAEAPSAWPSEVRSIEDIGDVQSDARIQAKGRTSAGLRQKRSLRRLWIDAASEEWIREVAELGQLEVLVINGTSSADLAPLSQLMGLRRLIVREAPHLASLQFVSTLRALEALGFTNAPGIRDLQPVSDLTQLAAFALEVSAAGADAGMDVAVETLKPLTALSCLEWLYLVSLKVADESLEPLIGLKSLKVLECGARFPAAEFKKLHLANPQLVCQWFTVIDTPAWDRMYRRRSRSKGSKRK
jgi:hypothetical protein